MQYGFQCEDCEIAIFVVAPRGELAWLRDRAHVVREVAKHADSLDTWMADGIAFLNDHAGHSILIVSKKA